MKKFILLSLLNVLFFTAFSQKSGIQPEILTTIDIIKSADANTDPLDNPYQVGWPFLFTYNNIYTDIDPTGKTYIYCMGVGPYVCFPSIKDIFIYIRGVATESIETVCHEIIQESNEQIGNGIFNGSITRKLAYMDAERTNLTSYILFQIHWDNQPENPLNGTARIMISKISDMGM